MYHWNWKCPYCKTEITSGTGEEPSIPEIWIPFYRCKVCGGLIRTGSNEYLTLPPAYRLSIKPTLAISKEIANSIDRTNSEEYKDFLKKMGHTFYPIEQKDIDTFKNVDFDKCGMEPSEEAMAGLYNIGAIIDEKNYDKERKTYNKEFLDKNKKYNKNLNISKVFGFLGFAMFAGMTIHFLGPDSMLSCILAIIFGLLGMFILGSLTMLILQNIQSEDNSNNNQDNNENNKGSPEDNYKEDVRYCTKCGYQVFEDESKCSNCGRSVNADEKDENPERELEQQQIDNNKNEKKQLETDSYKKKQDIALLEDLYNKGIITKKEFKEKSMQIIDR